MIEFQAPFYVSICEHPQYPTHLKLLTSTLFVGGMSLQEMTGLGAEEASGSLAVGHGSYTEREDSCSRGDYCGLGTHGRLEWCNDEDEEDL